MLTTDDMLLEVEKSSKMIWYYLLSYGLSFTIVAISLAIDPSAYTRADYCVWMDANNLFYFTFLAPIVCFVIVSFFFCKFSAKFLNIDFFRPVLFIRHLLFIQCAKSIKLHLKIRSIPDWLH